MWPVLMNYLKFCKAPTFQTCNTNITPLFLVLFSDPTTPGTEEQFFFFNK